MDNSSLSELLQLFEQIDPLQKKVEGLGFGLDAPALNETRNATYHLIKAIKSDNPSDEKEQFDKAKRHAKRAIYDCHEAVLLHELDKFRVFKNDYKNSVVTDVLSDYVILKNEANKAKLCISNARKNYESREEFYTQINPHVNKLIAINEVCEDAREELNKIIKKEIKQTRLVVFGLLLAGLTLCVTWLSIKK